METDITMIGEPIEARLLFLSASANGRSPIAVDREYNQVMQALGVGSAGKIAVEHVPAVTWKQVPQQLLSHRASIVHFAGHGYPDGSLEFTTHEGGHQRILPDGLASLLKVYAKQVRVVVLNACYSDALADALTERIDVVIGMTHAVSDEAAIQFAPTFYQQLAGGQSVQTAYEVARSVLRGQLPRTGEATRDVALSPVTSDDILPQLRVREGVDASTLVFVPPEAAGVERATSGHGLLALLADHKGAAGAGVAAIMLTLLGWWVLGSPPPATDKLPVSRTVADCAAASTFTFQITRPNGTAAEGVRLHADAKSSSGIRSFTGVVSESGSVLLCIPDIKSGDMVGVSVAPASFRILFPPQRQSPVSRDGSPAIVVCEPSRDCDLRSAEVDALVRMAERGTQALSAQAKGAYFRGWVEHIVAQQAGSSSENAKLLAALVRKERQIEASSRASTLLRRYVNRAREVIVRFERHAERALDYRSQTNVGQMNAAIREYNPAFREMTEQADSYVKQTSDDWSSEISAELRTLIDEALEIHHQGIKPLNESSTLINDCVKKRPICPGTDAARTELRKVLKQLRDATLPRLDRFDKQTTKWLDSLNGRLFDDLAPSGPTLGPRRNDK